MGTPSYHPLSSPAPSPTTPPLLIGPQSWSKNEEEEEGNRGSCKIGRRWRRPRDWVGEGQVRSRKKRRRRMRIRFEEGADGGGKRTSWEREEVE